MMGLSHYTSAAALLNRLKSGFMVGFFHIKVDIVLIFLK